MMRVISSPSISTTGLATLILLIEWFLVAGTIAGKFLGGPIASAGESAKCGGG
jgi:hypothetical protein